MSEIQSAEDRYAPWLREMAELVNQQSPEERQRSRQMIGELLHDIKDTLGLITGANSILGRDLGEVTEDEDRSEMLKISNNATMLLNQYTNLVGENFANQIDAEQTK